MEKQQLKQPPAGAAFTMDTEPEGVPEPLEMTLCGHSGSDLVVAAAVPAIRPGDVTGNALAIGTLLEEAVKKPCALVLFSDMALTGAFCGELFRTKTLQEACLKKITELARMTAGSPIFAVLTTPLRVGCHLVKAAVWLHRGNVWRISPLRPALAHEIPYFSDPGALRHEDKELFVQNLLGKTATESRGSVKKGFSLDMALWTDDSSDANVHMLFVPAEQMDHGLPCLSSGMIPCSVSFFSENKPRVGGPHFADGPMDGPADDSACSLRTGSPADALAGKITSDLTVGSAPECDPVSPEHRQFQGTIPFFLLPSARHEWTGHAACCRRTLSCFARDQRAVILCANAGEGESVGEGVCSGRRTIFCDNRILASGGPYTTGLTTAVLSRETLLRLAFGKTSAGDPDAELPPTARPSPEISTASCAEKQGAFLVGDETDPAENSRFPYVDASGVGRREFFSETIAILAHALAGRLKQIGARPVIGLSGGLDSSIAFLACLEAASILKREPEFVLACSMPGPGTSGASVRLSRALGTAARADFREISIADEVASHLSAIGHDGATRDVTYENAQARERTQVLMDLANMENGLVVGTGDLSEMALGWCTYNGDQMSMYSVNGSLPKTAIRYMTEAAAEALERGDFLPSLEPENARTMAAVLREILARPVSPELLPPHADGSLRQITEDAVGPYDLIDFFLWHFIVRRKKPSEILNHAESVFRGVYDRETIRHWLASFIRRFFRSQFKRKASPDGAAAFPWLIAPVTSWNMPSDAQYALWLEELDKP